MHVFLLLCYLMVSVIRLSAGFLLEGYGLRRPEQHVSAIFVTSNGRHSLEVVALHLVSSPTFSSPVWAWETGWKAGPARLLDSPQAGSKCGSCAHQPFLPPAFQELIHIHNEGKYWDETFVFFIKLASQQIYSRKWIVCFLLFVVWVLNSQCLLDGQRREQRDLGYLQTKEHDV